MNHDTQPEVSISSPVNCNDLKLLLGHILAELFQDPILKCLHKCFRLSREPGNGIFDIVKK